MTVQAPRYEPAQRHRRDARAKVELLLEQFGLSRTWKIYPRQHSGGLRLRVSFLSKVVQDRLVLLLDEAFGALDAITCEELQRWLLLMWQTHGSSIVFITHAIREAVRIADRVLALPAHPIPSSATCMSAANFRAQTGSFSLLG